MAVPATSPIAVRQPSIWLNCKISCYRRRPVANMASNAPKRSWGISVATVAKGENCSIRKIVMSCLQ